MAGRVPVTLEEKQAEKHRLAQAYRRKKRALWEAMKAQEPRIVVLEKAVRASNTPSEVLALLRGSWVLNAPDDVRFMALRIIDNHCNRMALREGRQTLDDPLPPDTSLYFVCRDLLRVR